MLGLLKNDKMGEYELEHKKASYRTLVDRFIGDILLCNNIINVDESVYDNMDFSFYDEENDYYIDIYQWYLCDVSNDFKEELKEYGLLFSYSDELELDVLCVDHYGTSWNYVLTDCPIFDTWEELEEYNKNLESESDEV